MSAVEQLLANAQRVEIAASHAMPEENPAAVNDASPGFLANHAAALGGAARAVR